MVEQINLVIRSDCISMSCDSSRERISMNWPNNTESRKTLVFRVRLLNRLLGKPQYESKLPFDPPKIAFLLAL